MTNLGDYVTTGEAARILGFHVEHVRRMLRNNDLEGIKVGQMWFVLKKSITKYQEATDGLNKYDSRRGN